MARGCLLMQTGSGWSLACSEGEPHWEHIESEALSPELIAERIERYVSDQKLARERVAVALAAESTLTGSFKVTDPADLRNRQLLSYQFEELLPLAVEDFAADFVSHENRVFAVAASLDRVLPIVSAIEAVGLRVQSIFPAPLAAIQACSDIKPDACDVVAWETDMATELVLLAERKPHGWLHLHEAEDVVRELSVSVLEGDKERRILLVNSSPKLRDMVASIDRLNVESLDTDSIEEQIRKFSAATLSGSRSPWIELRRNALAAGDPHRAVRSSWQRCLAAAAIFLITLTAFLWLRTSHYEQQIEQVNGQQAALYREAFPDSRVPAAIVSRLKSEYAKLRGARGREAQVRLPASATAVLYRIVQALPDELRYRVEQLRIENGQVDIDAQLRSFGGAAELAAALEEAGFLTDPPTTEQRSDQVVATRLRGQLPREDSQREETP